MVTRQTYTLFIVVLGFCFFHAIHAASTTFLVTSRLEQPLKVRVNQEVSKIDLDTAEQHDVVAALVRDDDPQAKVALNSDKTLLFCKSGQCKSTEIALNDLLLNAKDNGQSTEYNVGSDIKLAKNTKPGTYEGNLVISVATA